MAALKTTMQWKIDYIFFQDTTLLHGVTDGDITTGDIIRYCFELSTILGCLAYLIVQQGEEIKNSGVTSFYRNLVSKY